MFFKTKNFPSTCLFLVTFFFLTPTSLAKEYNEAQFIEELQTNPIDSLSDLTPFQWASITRYLASKVQMNAFYNKDLGTDALPSTAFNSLDPDIKTPFFRYLYNDMLCSLDESKNAINSLSRKDQETISIWKSRISEFFNRPEKINYKDSISDAQFYFTISEMIENRDDLKKKSEKDQKNLIDEYKSLFLYLFFDPREFDRRVDTKVPFLNRNFPVVGLAGLEEFLMANSVQIFLTGVSIKRLSYDGSKKALPGRKVTAHDRGHRIFSRKLYNITSSNSRLSLQLPSKDRLIYYQILDSLDPDQIEDKQHRSIFDFNLRNAEITRKFIDDMRDNPMTLLTLFHQTHEIVTEHQCGYYLDWQLVYKKYAEDDRCQSEDLIDYFEKFMKDVAKSDRINQPILKRLFGQTTDFIRLRNDPDYFRNQARFGIQDVKNWVLNNKALIFSEDID